MVVKKVVKVASEGMCGQKLTRSEEIVLHLLTKEFLTAKQIAIRRKTSRQAVSKIIRNLKAKGAYSRAIVAQEMKVVKTGPTRQPCQIRLHGQEFNIRILYKDERYKKILGKCNILRIDGNTVRLYRDVIEVYSCRSFFSDTVHKAMSKSCAYWHRYFARLEHEFKVLILKPRAQNISQVNSHYAEIKNELAKEYNVSGDKVRVYTRDDGKLWFTIDNSFNLHEAESLHPATAKHDMQKVVTHFNDLRDNDHVPLSKISEYMADTARQINELSHGLKSVVSFIRMQLPRKRDGVPEDNNKPDYFG